VSEPAITLAGMGSHIVWDWNGTLFHDIEAVVAATNASLAVLGVPAITVDRYRALYCQPIPLFYQRLTGRALIDAEWRQIDVTYFDTYHQAIVDCGLADGAEALLRDWHDRGRTQSLLSLYPHEHLVPLVGRLGVRRWFRRVDGNPVLAPGLKAGHLVRHLEALAADPADVVLIGDSLDDAAAAAQVGARCVLYSGGFHDAASLAAAGVPVVDSLATAVELADAG
jgi:phosphoglycolate phosphatase-like HAD superfamily hydrolase